MMPKGVDHLREFEESEQDLLVQKSLMPKGVDHPGAFRPAKRKSAKIFDAERR